MAGRSPGHGDAADGSERSLARRLLVAPRVSLATALSRGVRVTCRPARGRSCLVTLRLSSVDAKRLHLLRIVGSRRVAAGRSSHVRLTAGAARALRRHRRSVTVTVRAGEMTRRVTLRR